MRSCRPSFGVSKRGERDFGVVARVINCSLRHYDPAVSVEIAECSVAFRNQGVVAFDLAGGEAGRPPGNHRPAFDVPPGDCWESQCMPGEAAGAESIADAVRLCHADRIGHGTRLRENADLQAYIRDRRILIEANITSNVQTRAVAEHRNTRCEATLMPASTSPSAPMAGSWPGYP